MDCSIIPIVEGFSEVESLPIILRRLLHSWEQYNITIGRPVRVRRNQVVKPNELERRVELAVRRPHCRAIIITLDADDDCPKILGTNLLARANQTGHGMPISVVLAKSELESWFVGSVESLHGVRGITANVCSPCDPERIRDAKGFITQAMGGRNYSETYDQPALAAKFDVNQALRNCRSFKKFYNDLQQIVSQISLNN
jgi:hypothetical protein